MCGITGFWGPTPQDPNLVLTAMMSTLTHRGPDGRGTFHEPSLDLSMGHTRLSIIDLTEGGAQPIVKDDVALSVNGEFYDFKTIRARLSCDGARFVTKTDSEIAIELYQRLGLDFVEALRGEFAIALFDRRRGQLVLARDRFGVRPLYYHLTDDGLVYGSEIKAILAHPSVRAKLDPRAALHQMMQTMAPGMTAFEGVRALLPGHMMIVTRKGDALTTKSVRYWDCDFPRAEDHDPNADPKDAIEQVTDALVDAVRVRLEADVPVGCYLSGGIDSCSILGLSTAMQQSPVKAFTIGFDDGVYDETTIAKEMARSTNAAHEILPLGAAELYGDSFRRTLWHSERTFYNTLGVAKWHMSRRVRACGFKVVITGEGSDELFGGYPFFKRDHLLHGGHGMGPSWDAGVFTGAILSERQVQHPAMNDLVGFTPAWIQPWMLTLEQVRPLFNDATSQAIADYDPIAAIADSLDATQLRGRHALDKVQYTWIKTMLEGQILNWGGDRVDMANSMESRPPFLDHRLAEVCRGIPPHLRIRDGVEKWVLREAMKNVLPRVLYEREKFPFMAPPAYTDANKRAAIQDLITAHLSPACIADTGLFDAGRVEAFLERAQRETDRVRATRDDIIVNHLLGLHLLHQQFIAGDAPKPSAISNIA